MTLPRKTCLILMLVTLYALYVAPSITVMVPSISNFSMRIIDDPRCPLFNGTYYGVPDAAKLVIIIPGGNYFSTNYYGWLTVRGSNVHQLAFAERLSTFGFDVAVMDYSWFPALTDGKELQAIVFGLVKLYGQHSDIFLIGHSGGGAVVANYITKSHETSVHQAIILDAPLTWTLPKNNDVAHQLTAAAYSAMNVKTDTLLIYGKLDTTVPYSDNAIAWLQNAPHGSTSLELYDYGHSPWDKETSQPVREQVEQTIISHLSTTMTPLMNTIVLLIPLVVCVLALIALEGNKKICVISMDWEKELAICGGVQVRNKRGEVVLWAKGKGGEGVLPFALCLYKPELAEPEMREKLAQAFEKVKIIALSMHLPLFDMKDIARELNRMKEELGQSDAIGAMKGEDVTLNLTEVNTGTKHRLTIGIKKTLN